MRYPLAALCMLFVLASPIALGTDGNMVRNPGLEKVANGLPADWEPLSIGVPARFSVDEQIHHGGGRSIRIDAEEITRSYLRSAGIPVVAGEVIEISAWVKTRDAPAGQGTVILIAEFCRAGAKGSVGKVATAGQSEDWQHLAGRVTIPSACDTLRVRMGLSYSKGTTWWDDVQVRAASPLVARLEAEENRLYPARQVIPLAVLNRRGSTEDVKVTVRLGPDMFEHAVSLNGEALQRVDVPASITQRGKHNLTLALTDGSNGQDLWGSKPDSALVPAPLVLLPPSPTHWAIEDGAPRIELETEIALDSVGQARRPMNVTIVDLADPVVFERSIDITDHHSGVLSLDLQAPVLPAGQYRIVARLSADTETAVTAEQPWGVISRSSSAVHINSDGYPVKNGEAIFPMGMFNNSARLAESAEAGFNIVHFYNAARVHAGRRPDDQRLAKAMDDAHAAGMHVLLMVPQGFAEEGEWDAFTRRIRMFRNHPALLAWDEEEGLARGDMNMDILRQIRRIVREQDPHHPLMVGDARDVIGRITDRADMFPVEQMDLGMWWWYPFPLKPTPGDALQGEQASSGLLLDPPTFLTRRTTDKPLWVGLQAYKKPGPDGRYPTRDEYRAQAYLAIIHGARGLMWYGGSVTGGSFLNPAEADWPGLKSVAAELRELAPVLMGAGMPAPSLEPADAPVDATIKQLGSRRLLMAVNRGPAECKVGFSVPGLPAGSVRVIGESREVAADAGALRDTFGAYAAHVYELSR